MDQTVPLVSQDSTDPTVTQEILVLLDPQGQVVLSVAQDRMDQVDQLEILGLLALQVTLVHQVRLARLEFQEVLEIVVHRVLLDQLVRWELRDQWVILEVLDRQDQLVKLDNQALSGDLVLLVLQETQEVSDHWVLQELRDC